MHRGGPLEGEERDLCCRLWVVPYSDNQSRVVMLLLSHSGHCGLYSTATTRAEWSCCSSVIVDIVGCTVQRQPEQSGHVAALSGASASSWKVLTSSVSDTTIVENSWIIT